MWAGAPERTHDLGGIVGAGRVEFHRGRPAGPSPAADGFLEGDQSFGSFGWTVAAADANGDGHDDAIVGGGRLIPPRLEATRVPVAEAYAYSFCGVT